MAWVLSDLHISPATAGCGIIVIAAVVLLTPVCFRLLYLDFPTIKGIPEIPGGDLIHGHFYELGDDHATTAEKWSLQYSWPVFQIRMGRRRAILLNGFHAAREWLVTNQASTLDRPRLYTFHGVVSATSAATIGTNPWDERTKKQRRVVGSYTTGPAIRQMRSMLDLEVCAMISAIYYDSKKGEIDLMPHIYQKRLALNLMMMFCYSTRFPTVTDPLLLQILSDATTIASFRSTVANPQDFIPHLRYIASSMRSQTAVAVRDRRDKWLASMLTTVRERLGLNKAMPRKCVAEMLLTDSAQGLTPFDVRTILGGLISGGFETVFSTAIITIGVLATNVGQKIQERAYQDILNAYANPEEAFELAVDEERCPYISALVKEALRFYPPLKLLPARQMNKQFDYHGVTIPRGVLLYVNAQAANRDRGVYGPDADQFRPERWLEKTFEVPPPYHFSFGAGGRMCTAVNFSNKALYAIFLRLIVAFRITPSASGPPDTHYVHYKRDAAASNAIAKDFAVRFTPRDPQALERCFERSQSMSADEAGNGVGEVLKRD
ncbi:hypothetical protein AYL99_08356 [Fonsecaea erecta]|uniref:Phenylacetate 2-hydroxylase n=1 Tax=Fonsecaea erecta TaxID=1367422 RepID=A0A178ZCY3_9EURO|nr:hypothetical protein AYL99_08356 [Fonsecaea erecta]OAP57618.1 hypothetical protein AYL99_08356 [Fonsecaea erecta]